MSGPNIPYCVDCWIERELLRQAAYIYDGMSVCSRHMMARRNLMLGGNDE